MSTGRAMGAGACGQEQGSGGGGGFSKQLLTKTALTFAGLELSDATG